MNRKKDAEGAYRKAMMLAPNSAEPYNALGTLKASEGKAAKAEGLYRQALQKNPVLIAARHNLALLLAAQKNRRAEAIDAVAHESDPIPELSSLASWVWPGRCRRTGDTAGAIEQYRQVLVLKPDIRGRSSRPGGALGQERRCRRSAAGAAHGVRGADPQNSGVFEQIGDVESARGRTAEARAAYQSALGLSPEKAVAEAAGRQAEGASQVVSSASAAVGPIDDELFSDALSGT